MDPLTTALLAALSAAATAIASGVTDAAGGDAWTAAKARLAGWTSRRSRAQQAVAQRVRRSRL